MIVVHADWGVATPKQWFATAVRDAHGRWTVTAPLPVGSEGRLSERLRLPATDEPVVLGFDFPIGLPDAYAKAVEVASFTDFLRGRSQGDWTRFFDVADAEEDIGLFRPFYPNTYGKKGTRKRQHLTDGLRLEFDALLRRCERKTDDRRAACPLFWTCGGNQVGKGALAGWKLFQSEMDSLRFWPFDGGFHDLIATVPMTVVETYPTEFYKHLDLGVVRGKRHQHVRQAKAPKLLEFAVGLELCLDTELTTSINGGFGSSKSGEDQFDAVVGLLGMLNVIEGAGHPGAPADDRAVNTVEGWILGQRSG